MMHLTGHAWLVECVERSPLATAVTEGRTHSILLTNRALHELMGVGDREIEGRPFAELLPATEKPDRALELLDRVYRTGRASTRVEIEHALETGGDVLWWSYTVWPVALRGERSIDGLVVQIDDTTREHGERVDQQRQAMQIREVNERLLMASLREEELAARAVAAQARAGFLADASAILASSLDLRITIESLAKLTIPFLADWCIVHVEAADGALRQVVVAHSDAHDEEPAEVLEQHFPLQSIVDDVLENGAATLLTEFPLAALRSGRTEYGPLHAMLTPTSAIAVPIFSGERAVGVITLIITGSTREYGQEELALAQALARHAALALDSSRRMSQVAAASDAKSRFVATMSHELRTPLNAIMGYSDLLADGITGPVTARQKQQLERIKLSAEHLLGLINEVLTISRVEAGGETLHREVVDVANMFDAVTTLLGPLATQKHIVFQTRAPDPPIVLETDAAKVRQILVNLTGNAVKFTENGLVTLTASEVDGQLMLVVSDTGIGISPASLQQVFEPFWQVEQEPTRRVAGTGLGLSVSRRLARLLGGDLTVESSLGEGSRFTLTLPRFPAAS